MFIYQLVTFIQIFKGDQLHVGAIHLMYSRKLCRVHSKLHGELSSRSSRSELDALALCDDSDVCTVLVEHMNLALQRILCTHNRIDIGYSIGQCDGLIRMACERIVLKCFDRSSRVCLGTFVVGLGILCFGPFRLGAAVDHVHCLDAFIHGPFCLGTFICSAFCLGSGIYCTIAFIRLVLVRVIGYDSFVACKHSVDFSRNLFQHDSHCLVCVTYLCVLCHQLAVLVQIFERYKADVHIVQFRLGRQLRRIHCERHRQGTAFCFGPEHDVVSVCDSAHVGAITVADVYLAFQRVFGADYQSGILDGIIQMNQLIPVGSKCVILYILICSVSQGLCAFGFSVIIDVVRDDVFCSGQDGIQFRGDVLSDDSHCLLLILDVSMHSNDLIIDEHVLERHQVCLINSDRQDVVCQLQRLGGSVRREGCFCRAVQLSDVRIGLDEVMELVVVAFQMDFALHLVGQARYQVGHGHGIDDVHGVYLDLAHTEHVLVPGVGVELYRLDRLCRSSAVILPGKERLHLREFHGLQVVIGVFMGCYKNAVLSDPFICYDVLSGESSGIEQEVHAQGSVHRLRDEPTVQRHERLLFDGAVFVLYHEPAVEHILHARNQALVVDDVCQQHVVMRQQHVLVYLRLYIFCRGYGDGAFYGIRREHAVGGYRDLRPLTGFVEHLVHVIVETRNEAVPAQCLHQGDDAVYNLRVDAFTYQFRACDPCESKGLDDIVDVLVIRHAPVACAGFGTEELFPSARSFTVLAGPELLERYDYFSVERGAVILECQVNIAVLCFRCKRHGRLDSGIAHVYGLESVSGLCILTDVQHAVQGISLSRDKVLIIHTIYLRYLSSIVMMDAFGIGQESSVDGRHMYNLVQIIRIAVFEGHFPFIGTVLSAIQHLVDHQVPSAKLCRIDALEQHRFLRARIVHGDDHRASVSVQHGPCDTVVIQPVQGAFQPVSGILPQVCQLHAFIYGLVRISRYLFCIGRSIHCISVYHVDEPDGLVCIVQVLVPSVQVAVTFGDFFIDDSGRSCKAFRLTECHRYGLCAVVRARDEPGIGRNVVSVDVLQHRASRLVYQGHGDDICGTDFKVHIIYLVSYGHRCSGLRAGIDLIGPCAGDSGQPDLLVLVVDVSFKRHYGIAVYQLFERNQGLAFPSFCVHGEVHLDLSKAYASERHIACRHFAKVFAVLIQKMEGTAQGIVMSHVHAGYGHHIGHHQAVLRRCRLRILNEPGVIVVQVGVHRSRPIYLVINSAVIQLDTIAVRSVIIALQGHGERYQVIALIHVAGQLPYDISIIGICPQVVIHRYYSAGSALHGVGTSVGSPLRDLRTQACEPCACIIIQFGRILHIVLAAAVDADCSIGDRRVRVVGIGPCGMLCLFGIIFSVLIGYDDMGLTCCHAGHYPCGFRHALAGIVIFLREVPVLTLYLVMERIVLSCQVHHLAMLLDVERLRLRRGSAVEQISQVGTRLFDFISTVRQYIVACRTGICAVRRARGKAHDGLSGIIVSAVHAYCACRTVDNLEPGAA